ncbi:MAG TPA: hypothetical protein VG125_19560 [Pirellulales bacterium]|nr:hypothetical protein [Pirellulales bacterium]
MRLRFQFSLKALFVMMTGAAVACVDSAFLSRHDLWQLTVIAAVATVWCILHAIAFAVLLAAIPIVDDGTVRLARFVIRRVTRKASGTVSETFVP